MADTVFDAYVIAMPISRHKIAQEISYASSAKSRTGKGFIRLMENASGRLRLIKRAEGYEKQVQIGQDFWNVICERYGVSINVLDGSIDNIPKTGPLVLVSNHPFGILDGLVLGSILSQVRDDFRIVAHRIFQKAEDINRTILPISFDETKEALRTNMQTRKAAIDYLHNGGAIGIFPGGTVSTSRKPLCHPMDPVWRTFTSKMVIKSNAVVVPVFFRGQNSRLFQIASHLHYSLRMGLMINEFRMKVDAPVEIVVGKPIARDKLEKFRNGHEVMSLLRKETYQLSPDRICPDELGHEFENMYKQ